MDLLSLISVARDSDWERVREIRLAALLDSPDSFGSTYEREIGRDRDGWLKWMKSPAATFITRDIENPGIACLADYHSFSDAGLYAVWVDPRCRGTGIGDALIEAVIACARDQGRSRILLDVGIANVAAQNLYRRHGFVSTEERSTPPPPRDHILEVQYSLSL